MHSRRWMLLSACGLMMGVASGCYTMYPYPYGTYGYPGGTYPGGTYSAPPVDSGGSPTLGPGSSSPTEPQSYHLQAPAAGGANLQWQQSPQSRRQPNVRTQTQSSQPAGSHSAETGQESPNLVPDAQYGDPQQSPNKSSFNSDPQDLKSPFEENNNGADASGSRFDDVSSIEPNGPAADSEQFTSPITLQTAAQTRVLSEQAGSPEGARPNPYGYDQRNYRWLRGVVDYEKEDGSWNIIYSLRPDPQDEFGGSLRLVGNEQLAGLSNDDVVLVEGHIDPDQADSFGKPQYRVEHLARLVPER